MKKDNSDQIQEGKQVKDQVYKHIKRRKGSRGALDEEPAKTWETSMPAEIPQLSTRR